MSKCLKNIGRHEHIVTLKKNYAILDVTLQNIDILLTNRFKKMEKSAAIAMFSFFCLFLGEIRRIQRLKQKMCR